MAKERPPDWMPSFSYSSARSHQAASSAPGLRFCRALSNPPRSPESSDDENTSITNRCSPKAVYLLVSKLSEFKKELVRDIGFGGILDLPCINKVNLKLSAWLLTKLDTEDSELVLAESKRIYIHEKDVGIVFGIPCGDIDIASLEVTPEQIESIRGACGIISKDPRSFKGLEYVLEKHLDDRSSRLELDSFKMAFVIFVLGHLLAPSGKYDCLHLDFWGALKDTELLYRMNWCRYVYSHVLDAAQKARDEMIRKNRITNLIGCHLFLQVLFLDNVDIRGLNKKHDIIPRIKLFDADSFKKMATMCESRGGNDFNSFIAVRPAKGSAYMRHMYQSHDNAPRRPASPLPPPPLPAGSTQQGSAVLSADTYSFREHSDFGAYIRTRYPNLNKLYAIDYMRMHNAKMFREITSFRSTVMRQNATLLDWLVSNVDPDQLHKIHKKPVQSTPAHTNAAGNYNMNSPSTSAHTNAHQDHNISPPSATPKTTITAHHGMSTELNKEFLSGEPTSSVRAFDNAPVGVSYAIQQHAVTHSEVSTAGSLKRPADDNPESDVKKLRRKNDTASLDNPILNPLVGSEATRICKTTHMQLPSPDTTSTVGSEQQNVAVNKQQFDFEAPSFDLGIDTSPVGASYVTPKSQVVPMHSVLSPIPFPPTSPSTYRTSHSELPLSPISATVEIAKELVQDMIDIIEDGSSQKDYVLYGKQVTENFLREPFPLSALPTPSCPSHQINTTPDPDTLHMLHIYVRESKHIDAMSLWIVHPFPRQLVIPAKDIKDNFLTPMLTEFHIVDAIIRRLNQVDVAHKEGQINLRWRHFLESDFAMQAISGFHPELTQSVLNQFIHMDYSVPYCKKIIIPVLVHDIWAAYMYDMQQEVVHILDPGHSASRYAAHVHFQKLIYVCMENCFNAYFTGFKFSNNPNLQVHYPKLCELFPSEDSAFCMLHLARYFDGAELQILINKDDMHRVRTTFLFEALSLDQNEATLPGMVVRLTRRA